MRASPPSAPPVECRHLAKVYRGWRGRPVAALVDCSLTVPAGSVCALLGPNGAGKSTLFKILLGLVAADAGEARLWGRPGTDAATRGRVGYVAETDDFASSWSVGEVLRAFARYRGWCGAEVASRVERAAVQVGLEDVLRRRVGACSKGMRRRLSLAVALLGEPELLLLDEPASGLDPIGEERLAELLQSLRAEGRTLLLSTHRLWGLEALADQLVILHQGRVARAESPTELRAASGGPGALSIRGLGGARRAALLDWLAAQGWSGVDWEDSGGVETIYRAVVEPPLDR